MSMLELRQVSKALTDLALWADRVVHIRDGRIAGHTVPRAGPESLLGQDR